MCLLQFCWRYIDMLVVFACFFQAHVAVLETDCSPRSCWLVLHIFLGDMDWHVTLLHNRNCFFAVFWATKMKTFLLLQRVFFLDLVIAFENKYFSSTIAYSFRRYSVHDEGVTCSSVTDVTYRKCFFAVLWATHWHLGCFCNVSFENLWRCLK